MRCTQAKGTGKQGMNLRVAGELVKQGSDPAFLAFPHQTTNGAAGLPQCPPELMGKQSRLLRRLRPPEAPHAHHPTKLERSGVISLKGGSGGRHRQGDYSLAKS